MLRPKLAPTGLTNLLNPPQSLEEPGQGEGGSFADGWEKLHDVVRVQAVQPCATMHVRGRLLPPHAQRRGICTTGFKSEQSGTSMAGDLVGHLMSRTCTCTCTGSVGGLGLGAQIAEVVVQGSREHPGRRVKGAGV